MWIPRFLENIVRAKIEQDQKATDELRVISLKSELRDAKNTIVDLERKVKAYREREQISIEIGDPVPVDKEKRRLYVGAVAGLHKEILRPKLLQMIAKVREALENELNTREQDLQLKGTAYALWEFIRWGDLMASEDQAYNAGQDPSSPEDKNNNHEN